jgi:hypothetical protein
MILLREIFVCLFGAYRLALMDSKGAEFFSNSDTAFWRSFLAAGFVLPFYGIILVVKYTSHEELGSPLRFVSVELIAYVIAWIAFPLLMVTVAQKLGRKDKYFGFICAYNWASVLQNIVYLPVIFFVLIGVESAVILGFFILICLLTYTWFIAKTLLQIDGISAAAIVLLDLLVSLFLTSYADTLIMRG